MDESTLEGKGDHAVVDESTLEGKGDHAVVDESKKPQVIRPADKLFANNLKE